MSNVIIRSDFWQYAVSVNSNGLWRGVKFQFPNGYGASVIQGDILHDNHKDLFEIAVLYNGGIVYDTPITDDVLAYLTGEDVVSTLSDIFNLPPRYLTLED